MKHFELSGLGVNVLATFDSFLQTENRCFTVIYNEQANKYPPIQIVLEKMTTKSKMLLLHEGKTVSMRENAETIQGDRSDSARGSPVLQEVLG